MAIIETEIRGSVAVLTMSNGENRQDLAFARALRDALDAAEADRAVRAVVLTADDDKAWSTGVDLAWLMQAMREGRQADVRAFMFTMNEVFARLLLMPVPVIAAITGHAFGNGAMLACACDFRFMRADRGYFCFPEVDISIPFLPGMVGFVRKAVPQHRFTEMKLTGRRVTATELAADHVIEAALPDAEATRAAACDFAATFNKKRAIFGLHKRRLHQHIIDIMEAEDRPLIEALDLLA